VVDILVDSGRLKSQVQDLEDEIGVDLFRRSPRGVILTAEGKLLLEEAEALLRQVGFRPPVISSSLRMGRGRRATRLISLYSLFQYIQSQASPLIPIRPRRRRRR
jgi:DNA-binding transcriptional LysR family regulator